MCEFVCWGIVLRSPVHSACGVVSMFHGVGACKAVSACGGMNDRSWQWLIWFVGGVVRFRTQEGFGVLLNQTDVLFVYECETFFVLPTSVPVNVRSMLSRRVNFDLCRVCDFWNLVMCRRWLQGFEWSDCVWQPCCLGFVVVYVGVHLCRELGGWL